MRGVAPGSGGEAGSGAACCTVGGTATPAAQEDRAAGALQVAPQQEPLAVLLDFHLLQSIQVLDHIGPLEVMSIPGQPSSSSWRSTNARNQQNTWPRIVSSHLW